MLHWLFKKAKSLANIWATFVRNIFSKNFQYSPKLVTLKLISAAVAFWRFCAAPSVNTKDVKTYFSTWKHLVTRAVVVAQLTKRPLLIPEDPGSNPVIGNCYWTHLLLTVCRKEENNEKEAGNGPFFKHVTKMSRVDWEPCPEWSDWASFER